MVLGGEERLRHVNKLLRRSFGDNTLVTYDSNHWSVGKIYINHDNDILTIQI